MTRWIICFTLAIGGCVASIPDDPTLTADLAWDSAVAIVNAKDVTPNSDICDNCNGTGKVGDGTVFVKCPICGGTGKKVKP